MQLPRCDLHRPETLEQALELIDRHGVDAAPYAGGTELLLAMKLGMLHVPHLVDLKRIDALSGIEAEDGRLRIGSTVTHRTIEDSPLVRRLVPVLAEVTRQVANIRVRSVGTLAGNLAFSDPHADPPALLVALDAAVELRSAVGARRISIEDLLVGAYETNLAAGELITAIDVPVPAPAIRAAYESFRVLERPVVGTAAVALVEDGRFAGPPAIVLAAVDEMPRRVPADALSGRAIDDAEAIADLARTAADAIDPVNDLSGSAEYKRHLATVMTRRAIDRLAAQRSEP